MSCVLMILSDENAAMTFGISCHTSMVEAAMGDFSGVPGFIDGQDARSGAIVSRNGTIEKGQFTLVTSGVPYSKKLQEVYLEIQEEGRVRIS
jgi:hypothetical protein